MIRFSAIGYHRHLMKPSLSILTFATITLDLQHDESRFTIHQAASNSDQIRPPAECSRYMEESADSNNLISILQHKPSSQSTSVLPSKIMSHQKIALIIGSGPRVGRHVSRAFAAKGYQVALASRTLKEEDQQPDQTHFSVDLSNPSSVPELFAQVERSLGIPHVVVYNGNHCHSQNVAIH